MVLSNFELRPETGAPTEEELWLVANAQIDYETPAQRKQRAVIRCDRAETSSVTARTIRRGFILDVTNVEEMPRWIQDLPDVTLQVTGNLAALSHTIDLAPYAKDDENNFFSIDLGTVPAGITAVFGTNADAKKLTITYPRQTTNPASNLSFAIPLSLSQPVGTKIAGSDRTLTVRVNRFAPRPIYSYYPSPQAQARVYLDSHQQVFRLNLADYIQNASHRPLVAGHGTSYDTSWSNAVANFTITATAGRLDLVGTTRTPFPFVQTQVNNVVIRVRTDDVGTRSEVFVHLLLRTEVPA